ncbi:hypothetical protein ACQJBY_017399 [Aegilops geniculata]
MGFEVDLLGERVGRMVMGFMGKRKKQKVIHGPHATPTYHAPPPLPLHCHAGTAYWALPDTEDQRVNGRPPWAKVIHLGAQLYEDQWQNTSCITGNVMLESSFTCKFQSDSMILFSVYYGCVVTL